MPDTESTLALARRFFAAVTAGDLDALREIYAPDALIWHNTDGRTQTVEQNLRVLAWISKNVRDFRYEEIRLHPTDTGFVQQHTTKGTSPSGRAFAIEACIVCTLIGGKISRLDEYLDATQTAQISA